MKITELNDFVTLFPRVERAGEVYLPTSETYELYQESFYKNHFFMQYEELVEIYGIHSEVAAEELKKLGYVRQPEKRD